MSILESRGLAVALRWLSFRRLAYAGALVATLCASTANAVVVTGTFSGIVPPDSPPNGFCCSYDNTGVFGSVGSLVGKTVTGTFRYDTSKFGGGLEFNDPRLSIYEQASNAGAVTITNTINGHTVTITDSYYGSMITSAYLYPGFGYSFYPAAYSSDASGFLTVTSFIHSFVAPTGFDQTFSYKTASTDTAYGYGSTLSASGSARYQFHINEISVTGSGLSGLNGQGTSAADIARNVVGARYTLGAKGWDWLSSNYVADTTLRTGYHWTWTNTSTTGRGVDCSGLVMWSYNKSAGASQYLAKSNPIYNEGADGQYRNNSSPIDAASIQAGDLLFFDWDNDGYMDHVAMYAGGDDVVNASSPTAGILLSKNSVLKNLSGFRGYRRPTFSRLDMQVRTHSPISLSVTDPSGATIDMTTVRETAEETLREIPGKLYYSIREIDGTGQTEDVVSVPELQPGKYFIRAIPKSTAQPGDTYGLDIEQSGNAIPLAQDAPIADIPPEGYSVLVGNTAVDPIETLLIDVKPGSALNPVSLTPGTVLPVAILSTAAFDAPTSIDVASVTMGPGMAREIHNKSHVIDVNSDGRADLVFHFLTTALGVNKSTKMLCMSGRLLSGEEFGGCDTAKITK